MKFLSMCRAVMPEVLEVGKSHPHEAENDQDEIERGKLVHFSLLLYGNEINYDTESDKYQGQGNAHHQGGPGNGLPGKHSEYENCQAQFRCVVEELRQVIPSVFPHALSVADPGRFVNENNAKNYHGMFERRIGDHHPWNRRRWQSVR